MTLEDIEAKKAQIVEQYGPWTSNIRLADQIYTISQDKLAHQLQIKRVTQVIADLAEKPFAELRILDLACLEGLYSIEFALRGSKVVGIEAREANIQKARFAKDVLGLPNLEFYQDDVRNLSQDLYGLFDVVFCSGILYHLDAPDVFTFIEGCSDVCTHLAVIDTHISVEPKISYVFRGKKYWGRKYIEHGISAHQKEKDRSVWASIDNEESFWLTKASLLNVLSDAGFTSVLECLIPPSPGRLSDRITLAGRKGTPVQLQCVPVTRETKESSVSENTKRTLHLCQRWYYGPGMWCYRRLPLKLRTSIKNMWSN